MSENRIVDTSIVSFAQKAASCAISIPSAVGFRFAAQNANLMNYNIIPYKPVNFNTKIRFCLYAGCHETRVPCVQCPRPS